MSLLDAVQRAVVHRTCHLVAMDAIGELTEGAPPAGLELRPVTDDDVDSAGDFRDAHVVAEFRSLLRRGDRGVYAWQDGRVVGHFWAVLARSDRRRMWGGVDFGPREALLAWGNVREDVRGRGIFQAMIRALVRVAFLEPEIQRVLADLPVDPPASLAAHRRCGFRLVGDLSYTSVCGVVLRRRFDSTP